MGREIFMVENMANDGKTMHLWVGTHVTTSDDGTGWEYYATFKPVSNNTYKQKIHYIYIIKGIHPSEYIKKYKSYPNEATPGTSEYLEKRQTQKMQLKNKSKWTNEIKAIYKIWKDVLWFIMQRALTGIELRDEIIKKKQQLNKKGIQFIINKDMVKKHIKLNITPTLDKKIRKELSKNENKLI